MYASPADLQTRLGGSIFGEIYSSPQNAENDLAEAQAEIDGCIARRYRIPVTAPESLELLKGWTLTLCEERSFSRAAGSCYAEKIVGRVAQVRKYLAEIMAGDFSLPGAKENPSGPISMIARDEPLFTRNQLKGY